ncbi:hypothetical protein BGZ67_008577 [Mortierella alpina]|nr:hypothetical protein BGZ67_008577 [Mortierella alpina]
MANPLITSTPSTTAMQLKTATNQARNTLLRERRTGDNLWTCCDLTCDSAPQMYRHISARHEVEVQEQANKQLLRMRSRPASKAEQGNPEFRSRRAEKYGSDPISLSCSCDPSLGTVILFYAYLPITDPVALAKLHKSWSNKLGLYGKVKLATEGINATLSGHPESIVEYIDHLTELPDFEMLNLSGTAQDQTEADRTLLEKRRHNFFKPTGGCKHVFAETISIKVVEEICPLGAPELSVFQDPENKRGKLPPSEFHQKLKDLSGRDDVVVLDVRNYYESDIGRFPGAITPPIRKFSSFRDYVDRNRDQFSGKTLLSYCTGGIRCEKATTYLRQSLQSGDGSRPTEVLMLDGGIHNYLEWIKQENLSSDSLWLGKNYVFDARQSLGLEDTTENTKAETGDQLISVCRGFHQLLPCIHYDPDNNSRSAWRFIRMTSNTDSTAENQWLFRKEDLYRTPSLMSGLSYQHEKECRAKGVTFIMAVGMALKLMSEYRLWKDTIIFTEEQLLETLCFELTVDHPYNIITWLLDNHYTKDADQARKLKQVAWAFLNDSCRTTLCLLYPAKTIALAAIHLAGKYMDDNLNEKLGDIWRELYEPDVQDILDAANEMIDQYAQYSPKNSRSLDKMLPGSKPGSEYQENGTPSYGGYLNSPAKLATPVYGVDPDRPS